MSELSPEEFLNKKVRIIYEPMICQILVEKPKDPVKIKFYYNYRFHI